MPTHCPHRVMRRGKVFGFFRARHPFTECVACRAIKTPQGHRWFPRHSARWKRLFPKYEQAVAVAIRRQIEARNRLYDVIRESGKRRGSA